MFNSVYSQISEPYFEDTKCDTNMLNVENVVVSGGSISTAHTVFVDDLASGIATANAEELPALSRKLSTSLDECFAPHGF